MSEIQEWPKMLYREWPEFVVAQDEEDAQRYFALGYSVDHWDLQAKYKCEICGKRFKNALGLTGHMKTHKGADD